jgi:hypothetical protein
VKFFVKHRIADYRQQYPNTERQQLRKLMATVWGTMPQDERTEYEAMHEEVTTYHHSAIHHLFTYAPLGYSLAGPRPA